MRDLAKQAGAARRGAGTLDRPERGPAAAGGGFSGDAAVQATTGRAPATVDIPSPSVNLERIPAEANIPILGGLPIPPDPDGDVGPNHYVELVNTAWAVYSKAGTLLRGPEQPPADYPGGGLQSVAAAWICRPPCLAVLHGCE